MNIQNELEKIHSQYGVSELANYKIQLLFDRYAKEMLEKKDSTIVILQDLSIKSARDYVSAMNIVLDRDEEINKAHKQIRILLAFLDGQLDADREEHGENYAEATVSINAKEYLNNFINEYRRV